MFSSDVYASWQQLQNHKFAEIKRLLGPMAQHIFHCRLVLDIGCGSGYLERSFEANFIGIDNDIKMLGAGGFPKVLGDGGILPFRDESFDSIVSIDSMHLIEGSDFARVLKPGGLALLSIFYNDHNYSERKAMLKGKVAGMNVLKEMDIMGREKEYVIVAIKK